MATHEFDRPAIGSTDSLGPGPKENTSLYDELYYSCCFGPRPYARTEHWTNFFAIISDQLIRALEPKKVLDAGCAMGFLVEAFWDRGVEAHGVDLSEYAISQARRDIRPFCRLGSITEPIQGRYDLIACIEVLEHIPEAMGRTAIENLCAATDTILFSSTPTDLSEPTHVNVRPTIYWLHLFAQMDFWPDVLFDASFVAPHAMLLRRGFRPQDSVLPLFSELLRYKTAVVFDRSQIDQLSARLSALRELEGERSRLESSLNDMQSELSARLSALRELEAERSRLESSLNDMQSERKLLRDELENALRQTVDLEDGFSELRQHLAESETRIRTLREQLGVSQSDAVDSQGDGQLETAPRPSLPAVASRIEAVALPADDQTPSTRSVHPPVETEKSLAKELADWRAERELHLARIAGIREHVESLNAQNLRLTEEHTYVKARLDDIIRSPGWRLLEKYRLWLRRQRERHPRFFGPFDRVATWLLRKAGTRTVEVNRPRGSQTAAPVNAPDEGSLDLASAPVRARDAAYQNWIEEYEPGARALGEQRTAATKMAVRPLFSVIVPVYKVTSPILRECIESVIAQTYDNWELCVVSADPGDQANRSLLDELSRGEPRFRVRFIAGNLGIAGNSNEALRMAIGDFVALLDHDDTLAPSALFEAATLLNAKPDTDLIYSDHDYIEADGKFRFDPLFKPGWSPEIMLSANYISHLTIIRRTSIERAGGFDRNVDGAQDWDLFFKITEETRRIEHIPKVLYHWRVHPQSTALNSAVKSYAREAQLLALRSHMQRTGLPAVPEVRPDGLLQVRWRPSAQPLVSIVIPSKDNVKLLSGCISSLLHETEYSNYEILIVDNGGAHPKTSKYYREVSSAANIRVIDYPGPFNYSAANNLGVAYASGDVLLFLNDDVRITSSKWLSELVDWALHPEVGIVGGRLLYENGTIQHAGVVLGLRGFADHVFANHPKVSFGLFGSTGWYRNYLAVTGACMIMRRKVFEELQGFDENFVLTGSDVDICLRAWQAGYRVVYNPFVELIHYESRTRGARLAAEDFFASYKSYRPYLEAGDPYWNPNLSVWKKELAFRSKDEPSSLGFVLNHLTELSGQDTSSVGTQHKLPASHPLATEETRVVSWFDFKEEEVLRSRRQSESAKGYCDVKRAVWFIPPFQYPFFGGAYTILRFAEYLHREKGVQNIFAICGIPADGTEAMVQRIRSVCPDIDNEHVHVVAHVNDVADLPGADCGIATLWTTAYYALRFRQTTRKFYFVQDYEPAFYRAGSASALVENTYRFGFYGITNTVSLQRSYEMEYGGKAIHFTPSVNLEVFHSNGRCSPRSPSKWQVFCYARPQHPRNAFELLTAAMRLLKTSLGNRVRIVSAGGDWDPSEYGLEGVVENLGVLPYEETAELYRESDVGVTLMFTRHPSYIPMELMASGCLVVTNKNHWTRWLLEDGVNCLLSDASPSCVAAKVEAALKDDQLRQRVIAAAEKLVRQRHGDWTLEMESVFRFLCDPEASLAHDRPADGEYLASSAGGISTNVPSA